MIRVITYNDNGFRYVSHGINIDTLENVVLPLEKWEDFKKNCIFIENLGFVLK